MAGPDYSRWYSSGLSWSDGSTPFTPPSLASVWLMPGYPGVLLASCSTRLLGLTLAAMLTHAFHNTIAHLFDEHASWIVGTIFDWSGWLLMFIFILWMIRRERNYLVRHLAEEVGMGSLTAEQYRTACSALHQNNARLLSLGHRRYRVTDRFYQVCGELSHKKEQLHCMGEEDNNSTIIQSCEMNCAPFHRRRFTGEPAMPFQGR
jgi:hypothetical protein